MMSICFARNLNDQISIQISKWQNLRWPIYDETLGTRNLSEESDNVMITKSPKLLTIEIFKLIIIHCIIHIQFLCINPDEYYSMDILTKSCIETVMKWFLFYNQTNSRVCSWCAIFCDSIDWNDQRYTVAY